MRIQALKRRVDLGYRYVNGFRLLVIICYLKYLYHQELIIFEQRRLDAIEALLKIISKYFT